MCFRTRPSNCWSGGAFCHDGQEQCVVMGDHNKESHWPTTINSGMRPSVYMYMFEMPSPIITAWAPPHPGAKWKSQCRELAQARPSTNESWQAFLCGPVPDKLGRVSHHQERIIPVPAARK